MQGWVCSSYKFELHTPSVDWSTELSLPCDRRTRYFWTMAKALFLEENVTQKCILHFLHCFAFFFLGFISLLFTTGYTVSAAMRSRCLTVRRFITSQTWYLGLIWHAESFCHKEPSPKSKTYCSKLALLQLGRQICDSYLSLISFVWNVSRVFLLKFSRRNRWDTMIRGSHNLLFLNSVFLMAPLFIYTKSRMSNAGATIEH